MTGKWCARNGPNGSFRNSGLGLRADEQFPGNAAGLTIQGVLDEQSQCRCRAIRSTAIIVDLSMTAAPTTNSTMSSRRASASAGRFTLAELASASNDAHDDDVSIRRQENERPDVFLRRPFPVAKQDG